MSEGTDRKTERWALLRELDRLTDRPLTVLAFVWLGLLVVELTSGLSASLEALTYAIWGVFIVDFVVEVTIAPDRWRYLRGNWLSAVSLLIPAVRVLRVTRLARLSSIGRATRSLSLLRIVTSINRGMGALGATLARRGLGYVLALSAIVALVGAAGMLFFEGTSASPATEPDQGGFRDYPDALWWTVMVLVTIGSDVWPTTAEGRILTLLLAIYGFAVFGFITAAIASHFVGQDRPSARPTDGLDPTIEPVRLVEEVAALRRELAAFRDRQ